MRYIIVFMEIPQQYSYDHLIEDDQYGYDLLVKNDQYQSINNQVIDSNGHEMSNDSFLDRKELIRLLEIIQGCLNRLQKDIASMVESMENTDQSSKDETLIEKKSILTQELIQRGHEMPCEVNLEKNGFPIESSDQIAKDEEFSDEKFTNDLTQELKFVGNKCLMILFLENGKKVPKNQWI